MESIFDEFVHWWIEELRNAPSIQLPNRMYFCEERGTNYEEFNDIVTTLYHYLKQLEGTSYIQSKDGYLYFTTKPLNLTNCFINDVYFTIYPSNSNDYLANGDSFIYNELKYNKDTDKCTNCHIELYANPCEAINFKKLNIIEHLWHEVQHIYRQYCILRQENIKGKPNVKANYDNDFQSRILRINGTNGLDFIRDVFYLTDKDEIDARMQELIPFLQQRTEINRNNYRQYLEEFTPFQLIQDLKNFKNIYQIYILASDNKEEAGKIIKDLYSNNEYYSSVKISANETVDKLYKRLCQSILYAQNQFYKILFYTFQKLNRDLNECFYKKQSKIESLNYKKMTDESQMLFKKQINDYFKMKELYVSQFK